MPPGDDRDDSDGGSGDGDYAFERRTALRLLGLPALAGVTAGGFRRVAGTEAGSAEARAEPDSGVAESSADADAAANDGDDGSYAVTQGETCRTVVPLSGDEPVTELYDLRIPDDYAGENGATDPGTGPYYQSIGTTDLQRADVTISFLYDGPGGLSLVVVHDSETDGSDGGAASWTVHDVPDDATWVVRDDVYLDPETGDPWSTNYDRWAMTGETQQIDWTWGASGTDGGALRTSGRLEVTIEPAFNDAAELWGEYYAEDPITDWQFLSFPDGRENPERISLALDESVSLGQQTCEDSAGDDGDPESEDDDSDDAEAGDPGSENPDGSDSDEDGRDDRESDDDSGGDDRDDAEGSEDEDDREDDGDERDEEREDGEWDDDDDWSDDEDEWDDEDWDDDDDDWDDEDEWDDDDDDDWDDDDEEWDDDDEWEDHGDDGDDRSEREQPTERREKRREKRRKKRERRRKKRRKQREKRRKKREKRRKKREKQRRKREKQREKREERRRERERQGRGHAEDAGNSNPGHGHGRDGEGR